MSIQTDISKPVSCSHQLEIKDKCILAEEDRGQYLIGWRAEKVITGTA